jgi:hypothetical protein
MLKLKRERSIAMYQAEKRTRKASDFVFVSRKDLSGLRDWRDRHTRRDKDAKEEEEA